MRVLALTGSIAAGKSTVGGLFRRLGATVLDADAAVRELQQPGTAIFAAIVARFGPGIVTRDGTLDRAALRRRIIADATARRDLEAIVHPAVDAWRRTETRAAAARGERVVIAEIPLLFEAGSPQDFDGVIVVDAPESERERRLVDERGFTASEARALMAMQWPAAAKRAAATWVIDNTGDRAALETRTRALWQELIR
ncbi:MAG TPA: dephospho-CoA kinase [Gemmatimonadales bacterium]|jgi:dephospho-CoA kinase|nr:dephospho-CoA kinase [Gemmatimonadales bacterium]